MNRAWVGALIGVLPAVAFGTPAEATGGRTTPVFPDDAFNTGRAFHAVSGDGRWLAYSTVDHANMVAANPLNRVIFVRDLQTDTDYRVTPPNISFEFAGMSDDGATVAVGTHADITSAGDTNGKNDGFLWDRATGVLTLATVSTTEAQGDLSSTPKELSADGTRLLFQSSATTFAAGAGGTFTAVYVRDQAAGTTTLVNELPGGGAGPQPHSAHLSADGTKVVFEHDNTSYVSGDPDGGAFIRDMATGVITRASVRINGTADPEVHMLAIDGDGSHVAWSWGGNIKVHDLGTGTTTQANPGAGFLIHLRLSDDAEYLMWETFESQAVVQVLDTGVVRIVSVTDGGQEMGASLPDLTADGTKAFFSGAPPPAGVADVYVHELGVAPASTCSGGDAQQGQVSGPLYDAAVRAGVENDVAGPSCDVLVDADL